MTITIRTAEERDLDYLVEMNRSVHDLHLAAAPAHFKHPDPEAVAELFRNRLRQAECRVWMANVDELPAGYAVSVIREKPETALCSAQRFCELDEVGVSPAFRQQGVARALVERVLAEARAQRIPAVQLTCWSFNAEAQAAFAALGFRPMIVRFQRESGLG